MAAVAASGSNGEKDLDKAAGKAGWLITVLLSSGAWADDLPVEVVRVYDGDTVTVNVPVWPDIVGREIGVRIRGIDAPEIRGKCKQEKRAAVRARDAAAGFLAGSQQVSIVDPQRGKYFRIVADIRADGMLLSQWMLSNGHAREYAGKGRSSWCITAATAPHPKYD